MTDETKRIVETETWEASDHIVCTVEPPSPKNGSTGRQVLTAEDMCEPAAYADRNDEARARIAACASEALRVLSRWEAYSVDGVCPECEAVNHDDDCALMAVLKKAGIRP